MSDDSLRHVKTFSHIFWPLVLWLLLTFKFLSVSSLCVSLSSLSLSSRLCCRDSTFLSISCLCSLMATSSWPSWQRRGWPGKRKKKDYKNAEYAERFCKLNEIYGKICLCLWVCCTRFALCWSSPCLSFSALSISKTSWVLSSNSLWVSLWSHTSTFIEQFIR